MYKLRLFCFLIVYYINKCNAKIMLNVFFVELIY